MTTTEQPPAIDVEKLMGFVIKTVDDVGATPNTALVVMGDRPGLVPLPSPARCIAAGAEREEVIDDDERCVLLRLALLVQ